MDILRALASPDIEVRRKTLDLALDLVTSRNVEDLVKFLEKEVQATNLLYPLFHSTFFKIFNYFFRSINRQMLKATIIQLSIDSYWLEPCIHVPPNFLKLSHL